MLKRIGGALCVIALSLVSCQKLDQRPTTTNVEGLLNFEAAEFLDAIPLQYGTLVGVTQNRPGWVGLWFQRPDNTIVASFVNIDQGRIWEKSLTIPRK